MSDEFACAKVLKILNVEQLVYPSGGPWDGIIGLMLEAYKAGWRDCFDAKDQESTHERFPDSDYAEKGEGW